MSNITLARIRPFFFPLFLAVIAEIIASMLLSGLSSKPTDTSTEPKFKADKIYIADAKKIPRISNFT